MWLLRHIFDVPIDACLRSRASPFKAKILWYHSNSLSSSSTCPKTLRNNIRIKIDSNFTKLTKHKIYSNQQPQNNCSLLQMPDAFKKSLAQIFIARYEHLEYWPRTWPFRIFYNLYRSRLKRGSPLQILICWCQLRKRGL